MSKNAQRFRQRRGTGQAMKLGRSFFENKVGRLRREPKKKECRRAVN